MNFRIVSVHKGICAAVFFALFKSFGGVSVVIFASESAQHNVFRGVLGVYQFGCVGFVALSLELQKSQRIGCRSPPAFASAENTVR